MSNFIYYEKLEDYEEQVRKAKECDKKDKEIERLNNIINELEEYLDVQSKIYLELDKIKDSRIGCQLLRVKDKLKELKDSDKEC